MNLDLQKIVEYERVMPSCMQPLIGVMPGLDVVLREDLALISSLEYPSPDANQAFLLRTTREAADALIDEVTGYFKAKDLPTSIFISPACTPSDLPQRLLQHGFVKQTPDESWMVLEHLQTFRIPKADPKISIRQVDASEAGLFAEVMAAAYEMPAEWAPQLAKALEPSMNQPNFHYYLALMDQQPMATMTLRQYKEYAIVGAAGVLPQHRGSTLIFSLASNVLMQARKEGVDTVFLQTTLGPLFERFLRICGFKLAFKRTGYMLA
jgi:hypothetical protein